MGEPNGIAGAQSLRRALQILRLLEQHHEGGLRLSDVVMLTGLERSTAHRLLVCMVEEQFAEKEMTTNRYRLGIESMRLGFAASHRLPLVDSIRPMMQRLARTSNATAFLMLQHRDEAICMHREDGPVPLKVFKTNTGGSRPLCLSVGGLALLATKRDTEIDSHIKRKEAAYVLAGLNRGMLWRWIQSTRNSGFAEVENAITNGVSGISVVLSSASNSEIALSVSSVTAQFDTLRRRQIAELLLESVSLHRA